MSGPRQSEASNGGKARGAFTLIEIVVVITIIVILLAVSVPTIRALTKGNAQKQAVNLITMMLANARATAISTHKMSGIVIYDDLTAQSATSIQLITQTSIDKSGRVHFFSSVPRTVAQLLPAGSKVATLDDNGSFRTQHSSVSTRAIIFDATGQRVLIDGLGTSNTEPTNNPHSQYWQLKATFYTSSASNDLSSGVSSPGFLVYDSAAYDAALTASPTTIDAWMEQNSDILIVNPYTGTIIR